MNDDLKNNLSTIAVFVYGILAPYVAQYLTQEQFSALFIAIVGVFIIIFSARNPNTMGIFGNARKPCECSGESVLNDEYDVNPIDEQGD